MSSRGHERSSKLSKYKLHYEYLDSQNREWVIVNTNKILGFIETQLNKLIDGGMKWMKKQLAKL